MPPAHRLSPVPFLVCPLPLRRTLPLLRITGALTPPSRAKGPAAQPLLQQEIFREGGHGLHYARALRKGLLRGGGGVDLLEFQWVPASDKCSAQFLKKTK